MIYFKDLGSLSDNGNDTYETSFILNAIYFDIHVHFNNTNLLIYIESVVIFKMIDCDTDVDNKINNKITHKNLMYFLFWGIN